MKSRPLAGAALLDLLEPAWRRELSAGVRAAELDVEAEVLQAAARALGGQARTRSPAGTTQRWPACVIVVLARVVGASYRGGSDRDGIWWPGWHRAAGLRATRRSAQEWGEAFVVALALLGIAPAAQDTATVRDAVLAQATTLDPGPPRTADVTERVRLDPFGEGILLAERPALPEEVADPADPLLVFDEN